MMKVCVVIPIYSQDPTRNELRSIRHTIDVFRDRDVFFVGPEGLNTISYPNIPFHVFDKSYFKSVKDYSRLCCSREFYSRFGGYDYMVICQSDCWVFEDRLDDFIGLDYDYIGAPWPPMVNIPQEGVGNGGFSMRKVSTFIRLTQEEPSDEVHPEDMYWCLKRGKELNIAPIDVAARFSLEHKVEYFMNNYGKRRPMGCHKPWTFNCPFWKKMGVLEQIF